MRKPFTLGSEATSTTTVTSDLIVAFAKVSGDFNPIHLSDEYAATTVFGKRIAHGMLAVSFLSALLGNELPGPGSIYVHQTLKFTRPVFVGDTITAKVTVIGTEPALAVTEGDKITLETVCLNSKGKPVVEGEAVILYGVST